MYLAPRLSPDGGQIAYAAVDAQSGQRNIWIGDLKRGTRTRLTLGIDSSSDPIWTPDGQGITYAQPGSRAHSPFSPHPQTAVGNPAD